MLAEREHALRTTEEQLREQVAALAPQRQELARRSEELTAQSQQLGSYAEDLARTKQTLVTMQAQLAHDQKEVVTQRESLLECLGSAPPTPAISATLACTRESLAPLRTPGPAPKAAATPAARQFRKLRRDAKRKAIGV